MTIGKNKKILLVSCCLLLAACVFISSTSRKTIDYNTQVKPILNKKCITCHGGVKRKAGFSVLFRSEALAKSESGKFAIIPGDPDHSEMIRRINLKDPEDRMPYKHEPLNEEEKSILYNWIKEGAVWGDHWAYVPVKETPLPNTKGFLSGLFSGNSSWEKNDIDYFIHDKLEKENIKPSPEADKPTLLRRLSLDITGLPAPAALAKKFLESNDANAYEHLVDSLMASPKYGERFASMWLDIARYADTKGYERDDNRVIWRYRDWLIRAFNEDKPYDRFLTEQLAGDLLPNATDDQYLATAFQRNTMTNDEGGTDNEEFRTAAVLDRVNTTWEGVMGTTFACVQCHSHPYDPFSHNEYYKFMAFYNNTRDEDTYADYPLLKHFSPEDKLSLDSITTWLKTNGYEKKSRQVYTFLKTGQPAINSLLADKFENGELADTKWLTFRNNGVARLKRVDLNDKNQLIFKHVAYVPGGILTFHLDSINGPILQAIKVEQTKGWSLSSAGFPASSGVHDLYLTYTNNNLKKPNDNGLQFDWFCFTDELPGKDKPGYELMHHSFWNLLTKNMPTTPVMMDNPADMARTTNVFERGNWLVKGAEVKADVPHSLNPFPSNAPRNRLGMAMWMTSKQNPLTSRTMVNRMWEQVFGNGIVETLEDMGTQGAAPTHPELLDHLSYQFMNDFNWSTKKLLKEIVMSATYRQDSRVSKELLEKDPYNKLYARGARVRLSAEQVRDQALAISGLLSEKMYGAPVMPWQPQGIWLSPYNGRSWVKSDNDDQYRRALYTFWKRTAPYPSMISFDGVSREVCSVRRIRTNTPLQALTTMNDSVYLEASRHLAWKMQEKSKDNKDVGNIINEGYKLALSKQITTERLVALKNLYAKAYQKLKNDPDKMCGINGQPDEHNNAETAALVIVANAILNLDEVITKN
jgi:hypothetical protein